MKPQIVNTRMHGLVKKSRVIKAALFVITMLMVVTMTGSLYFRDRVYITDNGVTKELMTSETNLYEILNFGGYTIGEHDEVTYTNEEDETAHITIHRAFDVIVKADGKDITVPVIDGTVAQVIEKAGVTLGENDLIDCDAEQKVTEGMSIGITRVEYKLRLNTSEIPFETQYVENSNLVIGEERIVCEGENGVKTYYVTEKYVDGVLTGQELTRESVSKAPVTKIIERGTALAEPYAKMKQPEELTLVNGLPAEYTRVISGKTTAYTAGYNAKTASGLMAEIGTVAVNPNVIPYGSELYIVACDGSQVYGYAIAADTGLGMMQGTVLADLYFGNKYEYYDESCAWGAVECDIYVLSEGGGYFY